MINASSGAIQRHVRIYTLNGSVEGRLDSSVVLRLLDDMNVGRAFITLREPEGRGGRWPSHEGSLSIRRDSILFVLELSEPPPRPGNPSAAFQGHFTRAKVDFQIMDFSATGMLHVPLGGSPIAFLQHETHPFVALTSAVVFGPDLELEVPFLAINRRHILAVHAHPAPATEREAAEIADEVPVEP